MKNIDIKIQELIAEYLNTEISDDNLRILEEFAGKEGIPLDDLVKMYQNLDGLEIPEPSQKMDDSFYALLNKEKTILEYKSNRWSGVWEKIAQIISVPQVPRLAYGFILLLLGLIVGNFLLPNKGYENQITSMTSEMKEMRQLMVLSMIEGDKATERIKAVSFVSDMESPDIKIITALFETLNNDKNTNVRLVSLEALVQFAHLPVVREGMVKSIELQDSPIILMELADVLMQLQDKKSKEELQKLLEKEDLDPSVRSIIESGVGTEI